MSELTLADVLDVSYPSAPSWSADGQYLAVPVYEDDGQQLTVFEPDTGDDPWELDLGEGFHAAHEWARTPGDGESGSGVASSRLAVVTDEGDLLLCNARQRTVASITDGVASDDLAWTAAGDRLAVYREGRPTVVTLDGPTRTVGTLERGPFLGESRMLAWGPEDRHVAVRFTERETTEIAVFDTDTDELVWRSRDPATATRDPTWLADGRVLFDRIGEFGAVREFVTVDPASGTETVLFSDEDRESGILSRGPPVVGPDGERFAAILPLDGWEHLYVFDAATGERTQLTQGSFEDKGVAGSVPRWHDEETLLIASNRRDAGRRDIFAVGTEDGAVTPLVAGPGTDVYPRPSPDGTHLAFLHADHAVSPEIRLTDVPDIGPRENGERDTDTGTATERGVDEGTTGTDTTTSRLTTSTVRSWPVEPVAPERVSYESSDGREIEAYLLDPRETDSVADDASDLPAVVWVHGGPMRQMRDGWHPSRSYGLAYAVHQYLAHHGVVGLFVNYRGGIGYGREFRAALTDTRGRREMDDIAAGAAFLRELSHVGRVGVWGLSYGGYATLQLLGTHPDAFDVGVNLAGLADLELYRDWAEATKYPAVASGMARRLGGEPWESDDWTVASPITHMDEYDAPLYSFHGTGDRYVNVEQLDLVVDATLEHDLDAEWEYYPDENHVFSERATWERALAEIEAAFDRHLRS